MSSDDPRDVSRGELPPRGSGPSDAEATRLERETGLVWDALGAYPDEPVPADFAARAVARVRAEGLLAGERPPAIARDDGGAGLRVLPAPRAQPRARFRGLALAASLVAALGAGVLLSQRFLVREVVLAPPPTAALEAVPADLLDNEGLVTLASLPDADFEALLLADAEAPDVK